MTVYIFRQLDSDYFKIGFTDSDDVEIRRKSLQTGNPRKLVVYHIFINSPLLLEEKLHRLLISYRTDGGTEWFLIPEDQLKQILDISQEKQSYENETITRHHRAQSEASRNNGHDVRQVRGRQQDATSSRIQDVLYARQQDPLYALPQSNIFSIGKKHHERF